MNVSPNTTNPWLTRRGSDNWRTTTATTDKLDFTARGTVDRLQMINEAKHRGIIRESIADTFRRAVKEAEMAGLVTRPAPTPTSVPFNAHSMALPALASDGVELDSGEGNDGSQGHADPLPTPGILSFHANIPLGSVWTAGGPQTTSNFLIPHKP